MNLDFSCRLFGWMLDSLFATALLLTIARILRWRAAPARQRGIEWVFALCLLVMVVGILPRFLAQWPGWHLNLVAVSPQEPPADRGVLRIPTQLWRPTLGLYLLGAVALGIYQVMGHLMLGKLKRQSLPASPELLSLWIKIALPGRRRPWLRLSDKIREPMTFGIWQPGVLLPRDLAAQSSPQMLRAVLAHEWSHIRRRDAWGSRLAEILQIPAYPLPVYWRLRRDLRLAQEQMADAAAAATFDSPVAYAQMLLELLKSVPRPGKISPLCRGLFSQPTDLAWRIEELLTPPTPSSPPALAVFGFFSALLAGALCFLSLVVPQATAPSAGPAIIDPLMCEKRGVAFLLSRQQASGAWMPGTGPAITALSLKVLYRAGYRFDTPAMARGLAFIESTRQSDGGFYLQSYPSYNTAIVCSFLASLPEARYQREAAEGCIFLANLPKPVQWGIPQPAQMASETLEALRDAGLPADHPAVQRSLSQLMASSSQEFDRERSPQAMLPSYGNLTYAGLKSLLYAGVSRRDVRVERAVSWIRSHYTLKYHPGSGSAAGLFYFYHTFAKALRAYGEDPLIDAQGMPHFWRRELLERLANLQRGDGSWANAASSRYMEDEPVIVTLYSLMALQEIRREPE